MNKKELKERVQNIAITYDYEETYTDLYNTVINYMNETQDWNLEYLFEDYIDYDLAEERAKYELENGGLARLKYFLNDTDLNQAIFKVDGYDNLTNIDKSDLEYLKEEIIDYCEE